MNIKQFSAACERNREPILAQLQTHLSSASHVLEIGSGTGQHAVYFASHLAHLIWQCSDLPANHDSILAWQEEFPSTNLRAPWALDMQEQEWPRPLIGLGIDAIFTANTCHIMAWHQVQNLLAGAGQILPSNGVLAIYGPFNDAGKFTSASNAQFDASLRQRAPHMGLRDKQQMQSEAEQHGLMWLAEQAMPANNSMLFWRRR